VTCFPLSKPPTVSPVFALATFVCALHTVPIPQHKTLSPDPTASPYAVGFFMGEVRADGPYSERRSYRIFHKGPSTATTVNNIRHLAKWLKLLKSCCLAAAGTVVLRGGFH